MLHVKFEFHSNRDTLTYFTAKNRSKSFICIHGFKNYIEASDLVHTLYSECLYPYWLLSCLGNFWSSGGQKHSKGGVNRAPSQWHMRFEFHQSQVSASEEFSGLFSCDQAALQMVFSVRPSVRPSVCLSVRLSVCLSHLFHHVPIIVSSWNFQEILPWSKVMSMQKVKVRGQRSRSQRSTPNLAVSGL